MAMKKHKEATAQEQSCAVASFLFFRVERTDQNEDSLSPLLVKKGTSDTVNVHYECPFQYVDTTGSDLSGIQKKLKLPKTVTAPIQKGDIAGQAVYLLNNEEIGRVNLLFDETVPAATFRDSFLKILSVYLPT